MILTVRASLLFTTATAVAVLAVTASAGTGEMKEHQGACSLSPCGAGRAINGTQLDVIPVGSAGECCVICEALGKSCVAATFDGAQQLCVRYGSVIGEYSPSVNQSHVRSFKREPRVPKPVWFINTTLAKQQISKGSGVGGMDQFVMVPEDASDPLLYVYNASTGLLVGTRPRLNINANYFYVIREATAPDTVHVVSSDSQNVTITTYANWSAADSQPVATVLTNAESAGDCFPASSPTVILAGSQTTLVIIPALCHYTGLIIAFNVSSRGQIWNRPLGPSANQGVYVTPAGSGVVVLLKSYSYAQVSFVDALSGAALWEEAYSTSGDTEVEISQPVVRQDQITPTHTYFVEGIDYYARNYSASVRKMALSNGGVSASLQLPLQQACQTTEAPVDKVLVLFCKYLPPSHVFIPTLYLLYLSTETLAVLRNVTLLPGLFVGNAGSRQPGGETSYDAASDTLLVGMQQPTVAVAIDRLSGSVRWNITIPQPAQSLMSVTLSGGVFMMNCLDICCMGDVWSHASTAYRAVNP